MNRFEWLQQEDLGLIRKRDVRGCHVKGLFLISNLHFCFFSSLEKNILRLNIKNVTEIKRKEILVEKLSDIFFLQINVSELNFKPFYYSEKLFLLILT